MMLKYISNLFYRISNTWLAAISFLIFLIFMALVLPQQSASAETYSGGAGSPDTSLFYTPNELYSMAESYGASGRLAYINARFTFDLIFPFVYGFFLTALISWLGKRVFQQTSRLKFINLFPPIGMIFDFLENISASIVMAQYPSSADLAASLAPAFTFIKWIFVGGSFALLFGLSISLIIMKIKKER